MPIFSQLTLRRRSGATARYGNPSNIDLIFMDMMCCDVGRMSQLHEQPCEPRNNVEAHKTCMRQSF